MLSWRRAIQFAPDRSLDQEWFRSYEESKYGGVNSIDLQNIGRRDGSYDFISLSSVLEFVFDDRTAFTELVRIASPLCIIHCTFVPSPTAAATQHFGVPHGAFGRYHHYGVDVASWLDAESHQLTTMVVVATDPVTEVRENIHFFCRQPNDADVLRACLPTDGG